MPRLADVLAELDRWYPPATAESWDAVGLTCGDRASHVDRVVVAVDCLPATVRQAESVGAQLLLTHHPLLLSPVHGVPADDPKGSLVHRLISSGIAHYAAHTNADIAVHGVSQALAATLGLLDAVPLEPRPDGSGATAGAAVGSGRIGRLAEPAPLRVFLDEVARRLPMTVWGVRAAGHPDQIVSRVAVCGGAGGGYADRARALGADVFVTSDLKHHSTLETVAERTRSDAVADAPMALVDAAHWATEQPWLPVVAGLLAGAFGSSLEVTVSELVTDPWTLHAG